MKKLFAVVALCSLCASLALAQAGDKSKSTTKKSEGKKSESKKSAASPAAGKAVFDEKCTICHWADKADRRIGPGLKGIFKHEKMFDGRKLTEGTVREMILKGGGKMVGFEDQLEPKQVDALIA